MNIVYLPKGHSDLESFLSSLEQGGMICKKYEACYNVKEVLWEKKHDGNGASARKTKRRRAKECAAINGRDCGTI